MKDKIIVFIIGLLLGAIISTGSIYFYTIANNSNNNQMNGGNPPSMPNGNLQPSDLPNGNNNQSTN